MNPSNFKSFINLFVQIKNTSIKKVAGRELACISKLVFYCGLQKNEIPALNVRDVLDNSGVVVNTISKFKKEVYLVEEVRTDIREYVKEMENRNPALVKKLKPLFPSYRTVKTLGRHWEEFNTNYNEIKRAGVNYHIAKHKTKSKTPGEFYKQGSKHHRISSRQFYSKVSGKQIPSGQQIIEDRCVDEIMRLFEQAETIDKHDPKGKRKAKKLLKEFQEAVNKIKNKETRNTYGSLITNLQDLLLNVKNR